MSVHSAGGEGRDAGAGAGPESEVDSALSSLEAAATDAEMLNVDRGQDSRCLLIAFFCLNFFVLLGVTPPSKQWEQVHHWPCCSQRHRSARPRNTPFFSSTSQRVSGDGLPQDGHCWQRPDIKMELHSNAGQWRGDGCRTRRQQLKGHNEPIADFDGGRECCDVIWTKTTTHLTQQQNDGLAGSVAGSHP